MGGAGRTRCGGCAAFIHEWGLLGAVAGSCSVVLLVDVCGMGHGFVYHLLRYKMLEYFRYVSGWYMQGDLFGSLCYNFPPSTSVSPPST